MNKKSLILIIIAVVLIFGIFMYKKSQAPTVQETLPVAEENNTINTPSDTPSGEVTPVAGGETQKTYTLAQVATHNKEADCYSAINGTVYDLGAWIGKHPGGDRAILSICGKDGSAAFNGQHGGQMKPATILAGFEIGILTK